MERLISYYIFNCILNKYRSLVIFGYHLLSIFGKSLLQHLSLGFVEALCCCTFVTVIHAENNNMKQISSSNKCCPVDFVFLQTLHFT